MPSCAAVESLFSIAGIILGLSQRHCKMPDKLFDRMVFLKCHMEQTQEI